MRCIDPCRRLADLERGAIHKVRRGQARERISILREGAEYRFAVIFVRADKNAEILGCAGLCVNAESVSTHDKILNSVIVERA